MLCSIFRYWPDWEMSKNRNAIFQYRRQHPDLFPFFCETCTPLRRFKLYPHKGQHDKDKHGISAIPNFFEYSLPQPHAIQNIGPSSSSNPPPHSSSSSSSSSLGSITANELNTFIRNEIEPDTAYNQSCNALVDRLCQFMQNNFPDQLRPSEVRKVIANSYKMLISVIGSLSFSKYVCFFCRCIFYSI